MFKVDADEDKIFIGHGNTHSYDAYGVEIMMQLEAAGTAPYAGFGMVQNSNDADGAPLIFGKSRGTALAATTIVQDGDILGRIEFQGMDGSDLETGARIMALVDGTPGSDDMPARLEFATTADGANAPTERMRIAASGQVAFNKAQTFGTYCFWLTEAWNSADSTPTANSGMIIANNEGAPSANDYHHGITFAGHYSAPNRTRVGIFFQSTADDHTGGAFIIATRAAADASELKFSDQKVKIGADGNFQATDTSISSLSDERLKQNIEDFTYDLSKFKQYKPKTFQWKMPEFHGGTVKEDSSVDQFTQRGFVAQDVKSIDDYWLATDTMGSDHPEYDYVKDDPEVMTSKLGKKDAMYISVINQLITKIETLESSNTALAARIKAIEDA